MALPNEILVGRFNKALNAIFGIKAGAPAAQLGNEILPVHRMEENVEYRFQEGWNRWMGVADSPASVGNLGQVFLLNPITSGVIAVIEKAKFSTAVANTQESVTFSKVAFTSGVSLTGTAVVTVPGDSRTVKPTNPFTGRAALQMVFNNSNAGVVFTAFPFDIYPLVAGQQTFDILFTVHQELVLLPGDLLTVVGSAGNNELLVTLWWRERAFEESEVR